jgi:hypothetical protein
MANEYGDIFETYLGSGRKDNKGREIGFLVALVDNGIDFRALVQNARRVNGDWQEFGVRQRSKSYKSQEQATRFGYAIAHQRIAALK